MAKNHYLFGLIALVLALISCAGQGSRDGGPGSETTIKASPTPIPNGILLTEIAPETDIIFSSIRHALSQPACLDDEYQLKPRFIQDPDCNRLIYTPGGKLALSRQLFTLDIATGDVTQITNIDCIFISGQAVNPATLVTNAICEDSNNDGVLAEEDNQNLYLLDLPSGELDCLTCDLGLNAINNPDYSHINQKIVFSAQVDPVFHNYLFTIDFNKNLIQITHAEDFMDFDCAWSEDGTLVAFNRLPAPWFEHPAQIWLMNADGSNLLKITSGGDNPSGEGPHRRYPIGTDADADLSPDNSQVVFSRLKTGAENKPIGVWELVLVDLNTGVETVLDSSYANMVPEWKLGGIIFTRQIGGTDPMEIKQVLYIYREGSFHALEEYPFDVFPVGAFGGSWVELPAGNQ